MHSKVGEIREGCISGIQPYGAFVLLDNGEKFAKLAKEMGNVQNSTIVASSGEVLANIGEEKKTI